MKLNKKHITNSEHMANITCKALDPTTFDLITIRNGVVISRTSDPSKICNHINQFNQSKGK